MPVITLTNLTSEAVFLRDLYISIPANGSTVVPRSAGELTGMAGLIQDIADGKVNLSISYTADEVASGFDPYPGLGGGGAGGIAWDTQPWAQVYSDLVAAGGKGIILVGPGSHEMTPGATPTDLSQVLFVGISDVDGTPPTIDIDSLGVGGFQLGGNHNLQSQNVNWQSYYEIGSGTNACWTFDGGGFASQSPSNAYRNNIFTLVLSHGAVVDGGNCAVGLITQVNSGAIARMTTGAMLGPQVFSSNKFLPPFPGLNATRDSSTYVDSATLTGPGSWLHLPTTWTDWAAQVKFDDTTASPAWGLANVQACFDFFKTSGAYPFGQQVFRLDNPAGPQIFVGAGNPNGVITGAVGDLYLNTAGGAGTTLYVCEVAGLLGWAGK